MFSTPLYAFHIISNASNLENYIEDVQQLRPYDERRRTISSGSGRGYTVSTKRSKRTESRTDANALVALNRGDIDSEEEEVRRGGPDVGTGQKETSSEQNVNDDNDDDDDDFQRAGPSTSRAVERRCTPISCPDPEARKHRICNTNRSPWKIISKHKNTRWPHYHIVYISRNKAWGHNSRFGTTIRQFEHKVTKITCIACLLVYLSPNDDREEYRNILTEEDKRAFRCVAHSLGLNIESRQESPQYNPAHSERGNRLPSEQRSALHQIDQRMVETDSETDEILPHMGQFRRMESEQIFSESNLQQGGNQQYGVPKTGRFREYCEANNELVLQLCEQRAFDEAEAQRVLCSTPEGIAVQFTKKFGERLRTAINISRILVFQEEPDKRIERCKRLQLKQNPEMETREQIESTVLKLEYILIQNQINLQDFATITEHHFYGRTNKKNNLFFIGPPSTGKTMIMESLVQLHYNYERLTGLTPGSSFNFCSLVHTNACFMDECKLTDTQFEQWKLLAAGQPMATDVKYKNRHTIHNCRLYTASNYPIEMYANAPEATEAIQTRTFTFRFLRHQKEYFFCNAFAWLEFWKKHRTTREEAIEYLINS